MAVKTDFSLFAGDTKTLAITAKLSPANAFDLSDVDSIIWLLAEQKDTAILVKCEIGDGVALVNPVRGLFTVTIPASGTQDLEGLYYHECRLRKTSGETYTLFTGNVTVTKTLSGSGDF